MYQLSNGLNSTSFQYKSVSKRTLDMKGSKDVVSLKNKNKTTSIYTVKMWINGTGKFIGILLFVIQKSHEKSVTKPMENVLWIASSNLIIRYSKSGKSVKHITASYFDKVIYSVGDL